jgi:hypothetical protein
MTAAEIKIGGTATLPYRNYKPFQEIGTAF